LVVAVDPSQDGVVLATELDRPGGGIMGTIGDLGEGQETFSGPGVGSIQSEPSEVRERLSPLLQIKANHESPFGAISLENTQS
jgi:hypothetical protein